MELDFSSPYKHYKAHRGMKVIKALEFLHSILRKQALSKILEPFALFRMTQEPSCCLMNIKVILPICNACDRCGPVVYFRKGEHLQDLEIIFSI